MSDAPPPQRSNSSRAGMVREPSHSVHELLRGVERGQGSSNTTTRRDYDSSTTRGDYESSGATTYYRGDYDSSGATTTTTTAPYRGSGGYYHESFSGTTNTATSQHDDDDEDEMSSVRSRREGESVSSERATTEMEESDAQNWEGSEAPRSVSFSRTTRSSSAVDSETFHATSEGGDSVGPLAFGGDIEEGLSAVDDHQPRFRSSAQRPSLPKDDSSKQLNNKRLSKVTDLATGRQGGARAQQALVSDGEYQRRFLHSDFVCVGVWFLVVRYACTHRIYVDFSLEDTIGHGVRCKKQSGATTEFLDENIIREHSVLDGKQRR